MISNRLTFNYVLPLIRFGFMSNHFNKNRGNYICLPSNGLTYTSLHVKLSSMFYQTQLVDIFSYEIISPCKMKKFKKTYNTNFYTRKWLVLKRRKHTRRSYDLKITISNNFKKYWKNFDTSDFFSLDYPNLKHTPYLNKIKEGVLGEKDNYYDSVFESVVVKSNVIVYNFHSLLDKSRFYFFLFNSRTCSHFLNSISDLFFSANWLEREVSELGGIWFHYKKDVRNLLLPYGDSSYPFQKSLPAVGLIDVFYNPVKDVLVQNPVTFQL